ncbi:MAG: hypothetical protein ABIN61_05515 [candidate division WOR-3 bacterium]
MFLIIFSLFPELRTADEFGFGNISRFLENSLFITYEKLYSLPELQTVKAVWKTKTYGIGISHFGSSFYRELAIESDYKVRSENTIFITEPSLLYLYQESKGELGFCLDFSFVLFLLNYEFSIRTFKILSWIKNTTIPTELELSGAYSDEWNEFGIKINFLENWGINMGFGYKIKFPRFTASLGLLTNPLVPTIGFSFEGALLRLSIGLQNHPELGFSEIFTIYYRKR